MGPSGDFNVDLRFARVRNLWIELRDRCDVYFDNRCGEDAGVLSVSDRTDKICPATGIINNITTQMLCAQFTDEMCRRGAVPYFWMGAYRIGGMGYNEVIRPRCLERGY